MPTEPDAARLALVADLAAAVKRHQDALPMMEIATAMLSTVVELARQHSMPRERFMDGAARAWDASTRFDGRRPTA